MGEASGGGKGRAWTPTHTDTAANYLLHAVVEERQAGVFVTDKGALLDETDEDLCLGELWVELLVSAVSAL